MFVVTGAQGFIGSRMVKYLNSKGIDDICVIDDVEIDEVRGYATKVNYTNLQDAKFKKLYPIILDENTILPENNIEAVFHFGAISNTLEKDFGKIKKYNIDYTNRLNRACKKRNIPLIFSSTAAIYGNGNGPLNLYAESKFQNEKDISDYAMCFRLFNVYGPNESHKGRMASVIFKWFNELKETNSIKIFENSKEYKRDFIFVDDVCKTFYDAYKKYKPGIRDLGTGTQNNFDYVADIVIKEYGSGNKNYVPMPDDLKLQYQTNTEAKIYNDLELNFINIETGIKNYILHLKNNLLVSSNN